MPDRPLFPLTPGASPIEVFTHAVWEAIYAAQLAEPHASMRELATVLRRLAAQLDDEPSWQPPRPSPDA
jgi:hypothetical protein